MPQSFGQFDISKFSVSKPLNLDIGTSWQYVRLTNKSAYLLLCNFAGMGSFQFPELFLEDIAIPPGFKGQISIVPSVDLSFVAQAPSTQLIITAYGYEEHHAQQAQPLTFVSNVGNTVSTNAMVNTLSNEGGVINTEVIDIGTVTNSKLVDIFNDHFTWSVEQSGVAHQVLKGQTSGNPLQIGKSGDAVEFLGNPLVANNTAYQAKDSGGTARNCVYIDNNDQLIVTANSGPGGGHGAVVFQSDSAAVFKIQSGTQGPQLLAGSINLLAGSISRMDGGNVNCGSGTTISHGCGGSVAPTVIATPHGTQPGSATVGVGNETTTTFQATTGALSQISFWAFVR